MTLYHQTPDVAVYCGDNRAEMAGLPAGHFHCCVTSPPYFGLRSYLPADHPDKHLELGSEPTPDEFVAAMLSVFGGKDNPVGVWRVLRDDGVLFVNIGDSYTAAQGGRQSAAGLMPHECKTTQNTPRERPDIQGASWSTSDVTFKAITTRAHGLKPKDLSGTPWRLALALQAAGWYWRDLIAWWKPSPMPGSQRDRCTSSWEPVLMLTKAPRYFWDMEAVKEPHQPQSISRASYSGRTQPQSWHTEACPISGGDTGDLIGLSSSGRIPRNVWRLDWDADDIVALLNYMNAGPDDGNIWKIASEGFGAAHFATFPKALPVKCITAATSLKGCCPECGAPWVRVVDKERVATRPGKRTKLNDAYANRPDIDPETNWQNSTLESVVGKAIVHPVHHAKHVGNRDPQRHTTTTTTLGWRPDCLCYGVPLIGDPPVRPTKRKDDDEQDFAKRLTDFHVTHEDWTAEWERVDTLYRPLETAPCRTIDIFGGAGTTALAATGLQRHCTLIELSEEYAEMIVARLRAGLYATAKKRDDLAGQQTMFEDDA